MRTALFTPVAWAFLIGMVAPAQATIYTSGNTGSIGAFSSLSSDAAYIGEEFTAPGGALQSMTFYSTADGAPSTAGNIEFVVQSWDGAKSTGPALYSTMVQSWLGAANETITVSDINLPLAAGSQYIAYLAFAGISNPGSIGVLEAGDATSQSLAGQLYYLPTNNPGPIAPAGIWSPSEFPGQQLTYSATFGPTLAAPEPATLALLGVGLVGLRSVRRRAVLPVVAKL